MDEISAGKDREDESKRKYSATKSINFFFFLFSFWQRNRVSKSLQWLIARGDGEEGT